MGEGTSAKSTISSVFMTEVKFTLIMHFENRLGRRNSNPPLKKLRMLLRLRRIRSSEPSLNLEKSSRRLTEELLRRKRNSTIPGKY